MCLECVCMSVYMWWWCLGKGDLDEVAIFILLPFLPILSHTKLPHFTGGNIESWWTKEFSPRWHLQTDFNTNAVLILAVVSLMKDSESCCTMSFEVNFKSKSCASWCSDPNMRQRLQAVHRGKLQSIRRPWYRSSLLDYGIRALVSTSARLHPLGFLWCPVRAPPGEQCRGDPGSRARPRDWPCHFCTQTPRAIKKCSPNLFYAHQQCFLEAFEGLRVRGRTEPGLPTIFKPTRRWDALVQTEGSVS